jgi:uncharacterized protein
VGARTDSFDLGRLGLSSGESRALDLTVPLEPLSFGEEEYSAGGETAARLEVDRTTGGGYALRLRFGVRLAGPCMRCLESANAAVEVDAREIEQPGAGDEDLKSPYVSGDELDMRSWARDALALALPAQIVCDEACRGLCVICGANLNSEPEHAHEREPDPRWAKLNELRLDQ